MLAHGVVCFGFLAALSAVFAADPPARLPEPPTNPVREAAIEALRGNQINLDGLRTPPDQGGPFLNLGLGPNGSVADNPSDANLGLIANLVELERMSFFKGTFTKEGLSNLQALPKLRSLQFHGVKAPAEAFGPLKNLKSLEAVQITDYPVTDELLEMLAPIDGLKSLVVDNTKTLSSAAFARFLESHPHLETLIARGDVADDACMERIARLKKLKRLWVDSRKVTPAGWANLAVLSDLEDAFLRGTRFDDEAMKSLAGLTALRSLMLDSTAITDAGMASLEKLTLLSDLGLADTAVGDAGMVHLKEMQNLHNLYVSGTKVTSKGLANLPQAGGMRMLRVGQRPLQPSEFRELSRLFPRAEIIDPAGYWSQEKVKSAFPEKK